MSTMQDYQATMRENMDLKAEVAQLQVALDRVLTASATPVAATPTGPKVGGRPIIRRASRN